MSDLISRQAVIDLLRKWADGYCYIETPTDGAIEDIESLPSIDAVKHGRWLQKPNIFGVAYCSECDYELHTDDTNYCPACGAKMETGAET